MEKITLVEAIESLLKDASEAKQNDKDYDAVSVLEIILEMAIAHDEKNQLDLKSKERESFTTLYPS